MFDESDLGMDGSLSEKGEKVAGEDNPAGTDVSANAILPPQLSNDLIDDQPVSTLPQQQQQQLEERQPQCGQQQCGQQQQQQLDQCQAAQPLPSGVATTVPSSSLSASFTPAFNPSTTPATGDAAPSLSPAALRAWVSAGSVENGGEGASLDGVVGGAGSGVGAVDTLLQSQLATAGGIPSDPLLAMQMGARMALSGESTAVRSPFRFVHLF